MPSNKITDNEILKYIMFHPHADSLRSDFITEMQSTKRYNAQNKYFVRYIVNNARSFSQDLDQKFCEAEGNANKYWLGSTFKSYTEDLYNNVVYKVLSHNFEIGRLLSTGLKAFGKDTSPEGMAISLANELREEIIPLISHGILTSFITDINDCITIDLIEKKFSIHSDFSEGATDSERSSPVCFESTPKKDNVSEDVWDLISYITKQMVFSHGDLEEIYETINNVSGKYSAENEDVQRFFEVMLMTSIHYENIHDYNGDTYKFQEDFDSKKLQGVSEELISKAIIEINKNNEKLEKINLIREKIATENISHGSDTASYLSYETCFGNRDNEYPSDAISDLSDDVSITYEKPTFNIKDLGVLFFGIALIGLGCALFFTTNIGLLNAGLIILATLLLVFSSENNNIGGVSPIFNSIQSSTLTPVNDSCDNTISQNSLVPGKGNYKFIP